MDQDLLYTKQVELEMAVRDEAISRQDNDVKSRIDTEGMTASRLGRSMIPQISLPVVQPLIDFLNTEKRAGKYATACLKLRECGLEPEVIAWLTTKAIINTFAIRAKTGAKRVMLAMAIANIVHDEYRIRYFANDKNRYAVLRKLMKDFDRRTYPREWRKKTIKQYFDDYQLNWEAWAYKEKIHIGFTLLTFFKQATQYIETNNAGTEFYPSKEFMDKLATLKDQQTYLFTLARPMIVPPIPWSKEDNLFRGGYLWKESRRYPLIKGSRRRDRDRILNMDWSKVLPAINAMQETPWRVNKRMLEATEYAYSYVTPKVGEIGKMCIASEWPMPPQPNGWPEVPQEVRDEYMKACFLIHDRNRQDKGKRIAVLFGISFAKQMAEYDAFYFPHNLDSRGRAYPIPAFLNPQGPDFAKSMLEFSKGMPVAYKTQLDWICIAGANAYGYDKASLADRIKWVYDNEDMILSVAKDYTSDLRWASASEPFAFLRFCFEWELYNSNGLGYVSHYVVPVDATCSGLQHYAAMLRDEVGGKAVNLVPGDARQDVYGDVASVAITYLVQDGSDYAKDWLKFGVDRKVTKRQVMVVPYAGKFSSCLGYTREAYQDKLRSGVMPLWKENDHERIVLLSKYIWAAISDVVVKAKEGMQWLSKCASDWSKVLNQRHDIAIYDKRLSWVTPDGFEVVHFREDEKRKLLRTVLDGNVTLVYFEGNGRLSANDMSLAVAPNFVHSMDATHLRMTINKALALGIKDFAMVHDSFGVHAALMSTFISEAVRPAFVEMYEDHDPLQDFANEAAKYIEVPPMPTKGQLDLRGVLRSEFFFS